MLQGMCRRIVILFINNGRRRGFMRHDSAGSPQFPHGCPHLVFPGRFPGHNLLWRASVFRAFLRLACPTIEVSEVLAEERSYAKDEKSVGTGVWPVLYLPTARIRPNPMQPRKHFDTGGLQELAGSIRQYGVLQPLTVRKAGGAYELVAGERRLRAARLAD